MAFGRALERCRLHFFARLSDRTEALVLGDGDGRFLAALFAQNRTLAADAIDTSVAMLSLLRARCEESSSNTRSRLQTHHTSALTYLLTAPPKTYDLVVTHFFLDCLTQSEVESLVAAISSRLAPGALWLISDFRIPDHGTMHYPARLLIRSLYFAFRILTGLRTVQLPDHAAALTRSFTRTAHSKRLLGLLTSELWTYRPATQKSIMAAATEQS